MDSYFPPKLGGKLDSLGKVIGLERKAIQDWHLLMWGEKDETYGENPQWKAQHVKEELIFSKLAITCLIEVYECSDKLEVMRGGLKLSYVLSHKWVLYEPNTGKNLYCFVLLLFLVHFPQAFFEIQTKP